ncbi:DUF1996 domain-containing protein [Kineosporia sp. J2-2]|uniref:DUF1996 domain-containing protein n=1 Tax=Kineosporia corallincola TaxID=2835133 RepID=A0ABS5TBC5_9ACTN|nr:DUF1996 domain-containing protein [Kineosporia corallincola]MBT0768376.1 DUF1996 domain-containing protein [Kineosporia corallincola]
MPGWAGEWTARRALTAVLLTALFVAVAAVVPVLIQPGDPQANPVAGTPTTTAPVASGTLVTSPSPSTIGSPTPARTRSPFLLRPAVSARPVGNPPRAVYQEFPSTCALVRSTATAPVQGTGTLGADGYDVFGSTTKTLASPGTTPSGTTSCLNPGDRSVYWVPSLAQGGDKIVPESFEVLYKGTVDDYTSVQAFPAGLRILTGGVGAAPSSAAESRVSWSCTGYDATSLPPASVCAPGDRLIARIAAPGCWDGRHLDVPGHRSHLAWAASGGCPATHPVVIPTLLVRVVYPIDTTRPVRVPGLAQQEFGFGAVTGWQPKTLKTLVKDCVNAGRHCGADGRPD